MSHHSPAEDHEPTPRVVSSRVGDVPSVSYISNYITADEEARLIEEVQASRARWTQLSGRRLQNYGGIVHPKGLLQAPIPRWLHPLMERMHQDTRTYGPHPPNHVLVNAYSPGQGILPHQDGPAYWPGVCILSLAAPAVIRFRRKLADGTCGSVPDASLLLMPRSLLVFSGEAYTGCLHGIDEVEEERLDESVVNLHLCGLPSDVGVGSTLPRGSERLSLTVRRVEKVVKNVIKLGAH